MIVYVNTPVEGVYRDGVEFGCVTTYANPLTVDEFKKCRYVLVDQGLGAARRRLSDGEIQRFYARSIKAARAARSDVIAIVPDAFDDMLKTVELWHKWAPRIVAWGATPVLMLQQPRRIMDWARTQAFREARYVAIPSRWIGSIRCATMPRLCAEIEGTVARIVAEMGKKVHIAGGTLPVLRLLRDLFDQAIHSFDTMAYRLAVNKKLKKKNGGHYMATKAVELEYLLEWLNALYGGRP